MRTNLENILGEWGRWKVRQDDASCGYPSRAAFTEERVDCDAWGDGPNAPLVDDDMRRLDVAIDRLHPQYRIVVAAHYKWPGPVKVKHDRLKISVRTYYAYLEAAHMHLSNEMGGIYATGYENKLCAHLDGVCA